MKKSKYVRLNAEEEGSINLVVSKIPEIKNSLDTFVSLLLHCSPNVEIKKMQLKSTPLFEYLINTFWVDWLKEMYRRITLYGICPWYFKSIQGTIHRYPVVPLLESGYIKTGIDKKHEQQFMWAWYGNTKSKVKIYFTTKNNPPSMMGQFKTSIMSVIDDFNLLRTGKDAKKKSWKDQIISQYAVEYKPSNTVTENDNNMINARFMGLQESNDPTRTRNVRVKDAERAIKMTQVRNELLLNPDQSDCGKPNLEQIKNMGKGVHLRADFSYKQLHPLKVDANIFDLEKMLSRKVNIILDLPSITNTEKHKTIKYIEMQNKYVNQKIIDWKNFLQQQLKNTIIQAYDEEFDEHSEVNIHDILDVHLNCTSLISYDELKEIYDAGLMSKETFAKHVFTLKNLPESDICIVDNNVKKRKKDEEDKEDTNKGLNKKIKK